MHGNVNVKECVMSEYSLQYYMIVTFVSVHACSCVNWGRLNEQNTKVMLQHWFCVVFFVQFILDCILFVWIVIVVNCWCVLVQIGYVSWNLNTTYKLVLNCLWSGWRETLMWLGWQLCDWKGVVGNGVVQSRKTADVWIQVKLTTLLTVFIPVSRFAFFARSWQLLLYPCAHLYWHWK
jgi:hypothetical protein